MKHIPHFLTGMTVFVDGQGLLGTVKTVALPKVEQMRETIVSGGFERSITTGVFKAMECELTLSEYSPTVYNSWLSQIPIVIKGSVKEKGKSYPIVAVIKGERDIDDGTLETNKEVERKVKVYCDFYSLTVNNVPQVLLDVDNMIANIQGKDYLADMRSHLL
ncbi:MAG: phage major tail tube protein [Shewanella sp.]